VVGALERIGPQIEQLGHAQSDHRILPNIEAMRALLQEGELPLVVAQPGQPAIVRPVEELLACAAGAVLQEFALVVAVGKDLEVLCSERGALPEFDLQVWFA
jgi:hypothetical protein